MKKLAGRVLIPFLLLILPLSAPAKTQTFEAQFNSLPPEQIGGDPLKEMQDLQGKVVLVDFWASWCEPCKEALPHYNQLYKKYKDKGVVFIGINEDDDLKERDQFLKQNKAVFPQFADTSRKWAKDFNVQAIPSLYVFDKKRKPVGLYRGFSEEKPQALEKKIQELLKN